MAAMVPCQEPPAESCTVKVGWYVPALYVCETFGPVPEAPSPKFHEYVNGPRPPTAAAAKVTFNLAWPDVGVAEATTPSDGYTLMVSEFALKLVPTASVTIRPTVYVPVVA